MHMCSLVKIYRSETSTFTQLYEPSYVGLIKESSFVGLAMDLNQWMSSIIHTREAARICQGIRTGEEAI